jgi:HD-like signal output (HDOD) protein
MNFQDENKGGLYFDGGIRYNFKVVPWREGTSSRQKIYLLKEYLCMTETSKNYPAPDAAAEEAREHLAERFRLSNRDHPAIKALYELALDRETARAPGQKVPPKQAPKKGPHEPSMRTRLSPLSPLELLVKEIKLPALPQVMIELMQVINDPKSSAQDLAQVIAMDTSLSSNLLRIVNSTYYTFPFPIDTVQRAVALMGTREISLIAFSASFLKMFNRAPVECIRIEEFWKHSIACGTMARSVAAKCKMPNPERHFLSGLLHDLGRLVLATHLPEWTSNLFEAGKERSLPLYQIEMKACGFDHGRFGGTLLKKWNFPSTLVAALYYHHQDQGSENYDEPATIHVADIMAKALGLGLSGDEHVPPIQSGHWERLKLAPEDLVKIAVDLDEEIQKSFGSILGIGAN